MELSYDPEFHFWQYIWKKPRTLIQKNICTPMFITALFIIAKIWKQSKWPSVDEWIEKLYIYTQWNTTWPQKEGNLTLCNSMDGSGEHYAK